jgi:hypothetical protein
MPLLLEDLVEESSKSNHWATERLDVEARQFDFLPTTDAALEKCREAAAALTTVATEFAISRVSQAEGF